MGKNSAIDPGEAAEKGTHCSLETERMVDPGVGEYCSPPELGGS